jgi:hypothetical protein
MLILDVDLMLEGKATDPGNGQGGDDKDHVHHDQFRQIFDAFALGVDECV